MLDKSATTTDANPPVVFYERLAQGDSLEIAAMWVLGEIDPEGPYGEHGNECRCAICLEWGESA